MHCVTIGRAVSLTLVLSSIFMTKCGMVVEKPPEVKYGYLSVQESLLPMFSFAFRKSNEFFPIQRVNPGVRPYIRFYLENDNSRYDYVAGGIWLLGVVGTGDDVVFVDKYLQSLLSSSGEDSTEFKRNLDSVTGAIGCFAGMMLKRDMRGAGRFIRKYGDASAWLSSAAIDDMEALRTHSYFVLGAYQYSRADYLLPLLRRASSGFRPFLSKSALEALEGGTEDKYTEMMRPPAKSEETLKQYRTDFLNRNREWIEMLMKKQTYAQWREAREKKKAY